MKLQFAIAAFLLILGAVELLEWIKARSLPFPAMAMGGLVLAVSSNYRRLPIEAWLVKFVRPLADDSDQECE